MGSKHRIEILERAIVKAIRAARKGELPKVLQVLRVVEVDETQYPESVPLADKRDVLEEIYQSGVRNVTMEYKPDS